MKPRIKSSNKAEKQKFEAKTVIGANKELTANGF